jgi:hypothetical protein
LFLENKPIPEFIIPDGRLEELAHWAEIIEKTANQLCSDPECKRIKFRIDTNRSVIMSATDYDALDCFIQSFKINENKIPGITRKYIRDAVGTCIVKCVNILKHG